MLFGDRITPGSLQLNFSTPAASSPALYLALERLADEMALALIPDIL
ncbi:hypothetical protein [Entomohabitans teleogrylli]|nr:hypothetical protein [Entomohabitans teleogrylli]